MEKLIYEEKSYRLAFPSYFSIREDRIEAYFWPYKYTIPFQSIKGVEIVEKIPWYVGWGLRIDPFKKKLYFAIHHGKSVEVERKNGYWKKIVLSVKNPEKFFSIIKNSL
ncbi:MAG: hypothetical protein QW265_01525 [Candidatus Bathyarchaeia archaeon]